MGVATSCAQENHKSKALLNGKVDGAGMALSQKPLIMDNCTQRRWTTRICFTNNGTKPLIITNTQGSCGCTVPTSKENRSRGKRYYW
jgi:hypothetical protein